MSDEAVIPHIFIYDNNYIMIYFILIEIIIFELKGQI